MRNPKVHVVIEYINHHNDFCFDVWDVLESPENILNHYGIFLTFKTFAKNIIYLSFLVKPFKK